MTIIEQLRQQNRQFTSTDMLPHIKSPQAESPVVLKTLDVQVKVCGLFAETTQTMTFLNPNRRNFSGELVFPLPEGATVCGYALDIDGRLRDGVIVPKKEARMILEAEERKGADPGLIEQVQGNVYRTRIYPFPPQGTRTVSITYSSELHMGKDEAAYHLPLAHAEDLDSVSLKIEVIKAPVTPEITGGQGNLKLTSWRESLVAETQLVKGMPTEDLFVHLPELPSELIMVERDKSGNDYFALSKKLPEFSGPQWAPKRVSIAWDASGSQNGPDKNLAFLKLLAEHWDAVIFDTMVFRHDGNHTHRTFEVEGGKADDLVEYLKGLVYDGATDLGSLDFSLFPDRNCEAWLLFSDGLATVSDSLPRLADKAVHVINSSLECNASLLTYIASQTGGAYINLLGLKPTEAVTELCSHNGSIIVQSSTGCGDIFLSTRNNMLTVVGRIHSQQAQVRLKTPDGHVQDLAIKMDASAHPSQSRVIARQWAGYQTQKLALTSTAHDEEILDLARECGVVTPETSLLVLEELDQFVEYGIEPPESEPQLRNQYQEIMKSKAEEEKEQYDEHLQEVIALWEQRVTWWAKIFDPAAAKAKKEKHNVRYSRRSFTDDDSSLSFEEPSMLRSFSSEDIDEAPPEMDASYDLSIDESRSPDSSAETAIDQEQPNQAAIKVQPWNPDMPYVTVLSSAEPEDRCEVYLEQRRFNKTSPAFYLDCGDYFLKQGDKEIGLQILSNLLEMGLGDVALMRIYGWRLQQEEMYDQAIDIFTQILSQRDDEPQSYRDLALVYGYRWEQSGDANDIKKAIELLYEVVVNEWDRFPEIELIALMELNRLLHMAKDKAIDIPVEIDSRLIKNLDLDLRISLSWDADLTDVDLHVFEPTEEHAYYGHNQTAIGGLVSRDFTEGYGPEEYVLKKAVPGIYKIKAHYYSSHQQTLCGPCTVTATVFTNYSRPNEKRQTMTLRLEKSGDDYLVGEVAIVDGGKPKPEKQSDVLERFKQLEKGMTIDDITSIVGQPRQIEDSDDAGGLVLRYSLEGYGEIELCTGPTLISVRQIMDGAFLELL